MAPIFLRPIVAGTTEAGFALYLEPAFETPAILVTLAGCPVMFDSIPSAEQSLAHLGLRLTHGAAGRRLAPARKAG